MKEIFLICAMALPPGSFTKYPSGFVETYRMLEDYVRIRHHREPRLLYLERTGQYQSGNFWNIRAREMRPPWKTWVFDIVTRDKSFYAHNYFYNRLLLRELDRLIAPSGFLVADIRFAPDLVNALKRLGYIQTKAYYAGYNVFQKWYRKESKRKTTFRLHNPILFFKPAMESA